MTEMDHSGPNPTDRGRARRPLNGLFARALLAGLVLAMPAMLPAQRIVAEPPAQPGPNEGKRPSGWIVRSDVDNSARGRDSVRLVYRGKGYYLQSGPASLVYTPKNVARGKFILTSTMFSGPSGSLVPQGFGVFLGGKKMDTPQAEYTEFLVRNDGRYAVVQHIGPRTVMLRDWTVLAGILQHSGRADQVVRNMFRVIVDERSVQLVVNRSLATSFLRTQVPTEGEYGIRIGQKQLIQVESLGLERAR